MLGSICAVVEEMAVAIWTRVVSVLGRVCVVVEEMVVAAWTRWKTRGILSLRA